MDKLNFKTIGQRLKAETPVFWVKVRGWMIALGGFGVTLTGLKAQYVIDMLPTELCHGFILVGAVGTFFASLTAKPTNGTETK